MENKSLVLLKQGNTIEAKELIFSQEYENQKKIYSEGITALTNNLLKLSQNNYKEDQKIAFIRILVVLVLIIMLMIIWIIVYQVIKKWSATIVSKKQLEEEIIIRKKVEQDLRDEKEKLEEAFNNIKTLSGLVPICSRCKKIRDDKGYWNQLEQYIETHSDALFSHGLCPNCANELYGNQKWYNKENKS